MEREAWVFVEPAFDSGMLVCSIVVGDDMNIQMLGRVAVDGLKKLQKLLMPMLRHALADNLAFQNIQRGE